jgi:hypothetical protein
MEISRGRREAVFLFCVMVSSSATPLFRAGQLDNVGADEQNAGALLRPLRGREM